MNIRVEKDKDFLPPYYNTRRKRILMVTDRCFWKSGIGCHERIFNLYSTLRQFFEVKIFYCGVTSSEVIKDLSKKDLEGSVFLSDNYKNYSNENILISSSSVFMPLNVWKKEGLLENIYSYLKMTPHFDVIIIEYIWLAYLLDALPYSTLKIIDTHDVMSRRNYLFSRMNPPLKWRHISFYEEINILDKFDIVIAIQNEEERILRNTLKKALVICCSHAFFLKNKKNLWPKNNLLINFGYIGSDNRENYEAITWFLTEVWSVIRYLPVTLHIFGNIGNRIDNSLHNVIIHGKIDNIESAYNQCHIMVNPVFHGGGIKIKSLEALAYGKPLITTPEGASGIVTLPHQCSSIIIANSRSEFMNAIIKMVNLPNKIQEMGEKAKCFIEQKFSYQNCYTPLIQLIEGI